MPRQDLIRLRRGTTVEWAAVNPVLRSGEPGYDTDQALLRVGDGSTPWADLLDVGTLSKHDALYAWPADMQTNGALVTASGTDPGVPRVSLADAATQRCKWIWQLPLGWETAAFRWGWSNESAAAGNVVWQLAYRLVRIGLEGDVNAGAVTTIAIPAIAAPAQHDLEYSLPSVTQAIDLATGAAPFGQFLLVSLARLGADASDTLAGAASLIVGTITRV